VNEKSAAEICFASDGNSSTSFDVLREKFGEDNLFSEEFRADDEVRFLRQTASARAKRKSQQQ
jgi:hypothetical protein